MPDTSNALRRLRVAIIGNHGTSGYSGGRYHSLIIAYALARLGVQVTVVTNNRPIFLADLEVIAPEAVNFVVSPGFREGLPETEFDFVILVPSGRFLPEFYDAAFRFAARARARLALLNFESGNWFNAMAPEPRDIRLWDNWRRAVADGGLVLSSTGVSDRFARAFYHGTAGAGLRFEICAPPINSVAAAAAGSAAKDGSVVAFIRASERHKGGDDLLALDPGLLVGRALHIISGTRPDDDFLAAVEERFAGAGVDLHLHASISDAEKFALLGAAQSIVFPSHFEGFGYPPAEAAYMGTETVCYDLPVLRETMGTIAHFAPRGDTAALNAALAAALAQPERRTQLREAVADLVDVEASGVRLADILLRSRAAIAPVARRASGLLWGPFQSDTPDPAAPSHGPQPPLLRSLRRTPAGDLLISFEACTRGLPATLALGEDQPPLEDAHVRTLDIADGWRTTRITALLPAAAAGSAIAMVLRDAEGGTLASLPLLISDPEPMEEVWLALHALEATGSDSRLILAPATATPVDRLAVTADGVVWHEIDADAAGRFVVSLPVADLQRCGVTIYASRNGTEVAALGGMPPMPTGRRGARGDRVRVPEPAAYPIVELTDTQWRRGISRLPVDGHLGVLRCAGPLRPVIGPADLVRINGGPVRRVAEVRPEGLTFDLLFTTALNPKTEAHPGRVELLRSASGPGSAALPIPDADPNWRGGIWSGRGAVSGRCVLLPPALFTPVRGAALDELALVDAGGRVRSIQQIFDLGPVFAVWFETSVREDFTIDGALVPLRSAHAARLGLSAAPAPDAPPGDADAGRRIVLTKGARVAAGDTLVFTPTLLRRVTAVRTLGDQVEATLDLALPTEPAARPRAVRFASFIEELDYGAGNLLRPSPVLSSSLGLVGQSTDAHRRAAVGAHAPPAVLRTDRPRLLFVSIVPPFPADRGSRVVTHSLLSHVASRGFDIDLLLLGDVSSERMASEFGDRVRVFASPLADWEAEPTSATRRGIIRDLRALAGDRPLPAVYRSLIREASTYDPFFIIPDAFVRLARALYRSHAYHSVVCNYTHSVRVALELAAVRPLPPVAIVTHDALSRLPLDYEGQPFDTGYRFCTPQAERDALNAVPGATVLAISRSEERYFAEIGVRNPIELCEYDGLREARRYRVKPEAFASRKLVFHASGNPMNGAAIDWFLNVCWPRILAEVPDARLVLCGAICKRAPATTPGLEVRGTLTRAALMEEISRCAVAINPTLAGTGLKIKTVEAACLGLPSVCLPAAFEGFEDVAERFCVPARNVDEFVQGCIHLLTDQPAWQALHESAIAFAEDRFAQDRLFGAVDRRMGWSEDLEARMAAPRTPYRCAEPATDEELLAQLPAELRAKGEIAFALLQHGEATMAFELLAALLPQVGNGLRLAVAELAALHDCPALVLDLAAALLADDPAHLRAWQLATSASRRIGGRPAAIAAAKQLALRAPGSAALVDALQEIGETALLPRLSPAVGLPLELNRLIAVRDIARRTRRLGPGWAEAGEAGAQAAGPYAGLRLEFAPTARQLELHLHVHSAEGVQLRIYVDGEFLSLCALAGSGEAHVLALQIPAGEGKRALIAIDLFLAPTAPVQPGLAQPASEGLTLTALELREG